METSGTRSWRHTVHTLNCRSVIEDKQQWNQYPTPCRQSFHSFAIHPRRMAARALASLLQTGRWSTRNWRTLWLRTNKMQGFGTAT
jgi:hypothetical protein